MTKHPATQDIKQLLETIRVESSQDMAYIYDMDKHIRRLFSSISELGFRLPNAINNEGGLILLLQNQAKNKAQYFFKQPITFLSSRLNAQSSMHIAIQHSALNIQLYKLRIVYNQDASFEINIEPYTRDLNKAWKVTILDPKEFHVETNNTKWKHKFYPRMKLNIEPSDEVIWCNEHGHICEGSFTNIFFYNTQGQLCTPSLDCNILPGIMRSKIMETFEVIEGHYYPKDLENGFFLVNSMFVKSIS